MKKYFLLFVALMALVPMIGYAQEPKKKVAVYLTETNVNESYKKVIASKMVEKITQSVAYTALERTADFLDALKKLRRDEVAGEVRDSQIAKIGQQFGVKFVAVVDVSEIPDFDQVYVDARLINVETSEIVATASAYDTIESMNQLIGIAEKVSNGLTGSGSNNYNSGSTPVSSAGGATETFTVNGVSFEMVRVDGGTFMTSTYKQPAHMENVETFYIGKTEVTQALWCAVMGPDSHFQDANLPQTYLKYSDIMEFINRLNHITGRNFCLPTQVEWLYAFKGGNRSRGYIYSGSNNLQRVGWYNGNSDHRTHPVGTKLENELGLYDMSGNVKEWTSSSVGNEKILLGGSYVDDANTCGLGHYFITKYDWDDSTTGFRLAL